MEQAQGRRIATFGLFLFLSAILLSFLSSEAVADSPNDNDCHDTALCSQVTVWGYPAYGPDVNYMQYPLYGALVRARDMYASNAICSNHVTRSAYNGTWSNWISKQAYDQCVAKVDTAHESNGTLRIVQSDVLANQKIFGGTAEAKTWGYANVYTNAAMVADTLWFDHPGAQPGDKADIPFQLCYKYHTTPGGTSTVEGYADAETNIAISEFPYLGPTNADSATWTSGGHTINHGAAPNWITDQCNTGKFTMDGPGAGFYTNLYWYAKGTQYFHPQPIYQYRHNGKVETSFRITDIPSGVTCTSASGVFPGCEWAIDPNVFCGESPDKEPDQCKGSEPDPTCANPVNFLYGFKIQREVDYAASGALRFERTYRSNGTWLNFNMGKFWRHNYDRSLEVKNGVQSDSAQITTSEGTAYLFRTDAGANDWQALDSDVKATFTELYDSTPTLIGYLYTTEGKTKEYYNTDKKLTRIEYQGGQALNLAYDGSNRLSTVTDENGRTLTFSYDGSDRVSTVATPDGTFTYTYDGNNNLTEVEKPDTKTRTYHYEDTSFINALTGITNEDSVRYATWGYDSQGRVISSEHAGGVDNYAIAYNTDGTVTVTNPLGKETTYTYTVINGLRKIENIDQAASTNTPAASMAYMYTSSGYVASVTDWEGHVTTYEYDEDGLETSRTEAVGTSEERTVTTTWDVTRRLPDVIAEDGKTTDYDYDSDGRTASVTVTDTNTSETRTTTYTYYANSTDGSGNTIVGRLKEIDGPRTDISDKTTFDYDSSFRLIKTTDALGHFTETTSFDSADRPLITKDENGIETHMTYDTLGRLVTVIRAYGTSLAATTTFTYDDVGNLTQIEFPNGVSVTYTYDDANRLTGMEDDLGNAAIYTLDDAGNVVTEERKDPSSTLKFVHDQTFDELSRLLTSVGAGGIWSRSYAYDKNSNIATYTNANNNATTYAYDALNRLVTSTDALSGMTTKTINALNQTTNIEDPRSNSTTYGYNAFGDVTQIVSPDTGTASYAHDKAGNVTQMTDARSVVTNFTYDAINRLATVAYPSDSSLDVTLTYDDNPGTSGACGTSVGRLCRVVDASGTTDYKYNDLGQLTEVKEVRGSLTFTTAYEYDLAGRLPTVSTAGDRDRYRSRPSSVHRARVTIRTSGGSSRLPSRAF